MSINNNYIIGNQYFDRKYDKYKNNSVKKVPAHILSAESF